MWRGTDLEAVGQESLDGLQRGELGVAVEREADHVLRVGLVPRHGGPVVHQRLHHLAERGPSQSTLLNTLSFTACTTWQSGDRVSQHC